MKQQFDVFPKKLSLFGLVVLVSVYFLLMNVIAKNKRFVSSFYTNDVPRLQLYCGASRLISINQLLEQQQSQDVATLKMNQDGIATALAEMLKLEKGRNVKLGSEKSVEEFLAKTQDQSVIVPTEELEALNNDMQDFIENYLQDRNKILEEQTKLSNLIALIGIIGILAFLGILFYVFRLYRKNLINLEILTSDLEAQKIASMQSAKLASLGEMAGSMAHEINNPLAVISYSTKYLKKLLSKSPLQEAEALDCLNDIDATILRISKIIKGMRNVSRDSTDDPIAPAFMKDIFDDILSICSEKLTNASIELRIQDKNQLVEREIFCRRIQLSQVLLNLVGNSFDAISQDEGKKWIAIELKIRDEKFVIEVSDSGKPISDVVREKMFQHFYTTKEIGKGTGLGLSISKNLIESHGGSIYLHERRDLNLFVIEIPLKRQL